MSITEYLNRINFIGIPSTDLNTLIKLHECHVSSIPFENLDVQHRIEIRLEQKHLFKKIINQLRGGFCYELNYLFQLLLIELGFDVKIISARILNGDELGPEFDHMALIVSLDRKYWLVDVGFGHLFVRPIDVNNTDEQFDGRNYFKVNRWDKKSFLLSMSKNRTDYEIKYLFEIEKRTIEEFSQLCLQKQQSLSSYFVKNKVVTLPTLHGRKTIFNTKYIVKNNGVKTEFIIKNREEENRILKEDFNITI